MMDELEGKENNQGPVVNPQTYSPPRKRKATLWIGIISGIIVVIVILAVLFIFFLPTQSPIVGKWHITQEKVTYKNGTTHTDNYSEYLVFNSTGTGYVYQILEYKSATTNFIWRDIGNNHIKMIFKNGTISLSLEMSYYVHNDKITLESSDNYGNKYTLYGSRVQSIPPPPPHHEKLIAALTFKSDTSNINGGWVNLTLLISNPADGMDPMNVHIKIGSTELMYTTSITGDNQWTYIDLDGNNKVSDGEIIVVHSSKISDGSQISLVYENYTGVISITVP